MAGGGNISPRQKMINMMYLVLTAMLALNVSAEVLLAFVKIEKGLHQAVEITKAKNISTLEDLQNAANEETEKPGKIGPWADKAAELRVMTDSIVQYIQGLKVQLIFKADGPESFGVRDNVIIADSIESLGNTSDGDEFLIGPSKNGKAFELKAKILKYKSDLFGEIIKDTASKDNDILISEINDLLDFKVEHKSHTDLRGWEEFTFENTPLIANVAILTRLQVNVLSAESSIMSFLKSQIGKSDFKISSIEAAVNNPNGVVVKGGSSKAEVFLMAYDPNMSCVVKANGREFQVVNGKAEIPLTGSSVGNQKVSGDIFFKGPNGNESRKFTIDYQVVEPSLVVSATNMNVLYLGVENPIDVSVSGVTMDKINVTITNGTITGAGSQRKIVPKTVGECVVNVTTNVNGTMKSMEGKKFRVKSLPTPKPAVFGITGKTVSKGTLAAAQGVVAKMPEDFDFNYPLRVTGFTLSLVQGGFLEEAKSDSEKFTEKQRTLISAIKGTSRVMITDIKASGPAGPIDLPDLVYKVQ